MSRPIAGSGEEILLVQARRAQARERRRLLGHAVGLAGLAVCVLAIPGLIFINEFLAGQAEREAWEITGPACPEVSRPSVVATSRRRPPMSHNYGGARFTRSFGAVSCAGYRRPSLGPERLYHVCQFNNPGAVTVEMLGVRRTFEAEPGRALTVKLEEGDVRCVVGGWFRLR